MSAGTAAAVLLAKEDQPCMRFGRAGLFGKTKTRTAVRRFFWLFLYNYI